MTVGVKAHAGETATAPTNRGEAADTAILDATIEVLSEQGYGGLTMSGVIERSGVSSATLYRRWPTKLELVMAAIESITPEKQSTDTGSLEGDIRAFIAHLATSAAHRHEHVVEALAAGSATHPELDEAIKAVRHPTAGRAAGHPGPGQGAGRADHRSLGRDRSQLRERTRLPPGLRAGPAAHPAVRADRHDLRPQRSRRHPGPPRDPLTRPADPPRPNLGSRGLRSGHDRPRLRPSPFPTGEAGN